MSIVSDTTPLINIINSNHIKIENISFKNHLGDGVIIKNATECLIAGCNFKNILGDALIREENKIEYKATTLNISVAPVLRYQEVTEKI